MEEQELYVISDKRLPQAVRPELINYCPSLDLVALSTVDNHVSIYRLNGQLVYGATQKLDGLRVDSIHWKPNGKLLATAWNDDCLRLISAESNKIVHHFFYDAQASNVTCLGWSSNKTANTASLDCLNISKEIKGFVQDDDINFSQTSESLNLPWDLSVLDIENSLPKLCTLPSGGDSEDIFCTRSSLDALFAPFNPEDNQTVDVMIFGTKEGKIFIIIYDSFFIGSFDSPIFTEDIPPFLILHASRECSSTHSLILKHQETENLYFAAMDLRFISKPNGYLSLIASRSTALQNLLRYINQVQLLMLAEWKSSQEIPGKFLNSINETLNMNYKCDIVQALCHSVATGHVFPPVKEWLLNEVSERVSLPHLNQRMWAKHSKGQKRWEKAVTTCLESLKRIVHENMLPALERFTVILSRFYGIAKFQPIDDNIGFTSQQISILMDSVACLHLISSKILTQIIDEIDLFNSFSSWMRFEIDQLTSNSPSTLADGITEKESLIDHNKVFFYLQKVLTSSTLADHFTESSDLDSISEFNQAHDLFEILGQQLKKQRQGLPYNRSVLNLKFLYEKLSSKASSLFSQIAKGEKFNVIFGKEILMGVAEPNSPMDLKLDMQETTTLLSYFAFVPKKLHHCVRVVRLQLSVENGTSSIDSVRSFTLQLGDGILKDIKFSDKDTLLVLWSSSNGDSTSLLSLPYKDRTESTTHHSSSYIDQIGNMKIEYEPHMNSPYTTHDTISSSEPLFIETENVPRFFSKYNVPTGEGFIPEKLCVRRTNDREKYQHQDFSKMMNAKDDQRIVLIGQDGYRYRVFSTSKKIDF